VARAQDAGGQSARRRRRDALLIAGSFLGWGILFDGAMFALRSGRLPDGAISWIVAALPSLAAVGILVVYTRYLKRADELERLIQLQALGWGFGGGFFGICGYLLFEQVGAPQLEAALFASLMPVLFGIGILFGHLRYR
jgi:hypothetical protein